MVNLIVIKENLILILGLKSSVEVRLVKIIDVIKKTNLKNRVSIKQVFDEQNKNIQFTSTQGIHI